MDLFVAGVATGCLVGVASTFILLMLAAILAGDEKRMKGATTLRGMLVPIVLVGMTAGISFWAHLEKSDAMLVLLLTVLIIAKIGGAGRGLVSAAIAAGFLSFLFLPPVGSLWIAEPSGRFAVALFLIITFVGANTRGERIQILE